MDSDAYPAVVDGKIVWILDGYTTTDRTRTREKGSLRDMTSDAISPRTAYATLPTDQINYMRNSVKATVDAYDGTVDALRVGRRRPDPRRPGRAFPGVGEAEARDPAGPAGAHALPRGPVQGAARHARAYHVTDAKTFYDGSDLWKVPEDPTNKASKQPPYRLSVGMPGPGRTRCSR